MNRALVAPMVVLQLLDVATLGLLLWIVRSTAAEGNPIVLFISRDVGLGLAAILKIAFTVVVASIALRRTTDSPILSIGMAVVCVSGLFGALTNVTVLVQVIAYLGGR